MSKTLLLADDSVVIQKLVGLSFANEDIEILATDNGDDAVLRAQEVRPDVVLADVVMPGKSGYEVCEAIKQNPALTHIPVLLLTGTFEAFDEGRANAAGADGHITKPFEAQALVERVKTVLRNAARTTPAPSRNETSARGLSIPSADDLFAEPIVAAPASAAGSFFGGSDSLDVTPAVGLADLETPLETDLFGDGDEELGAASFSASIAPLPPIVDPVQTPRPAAPGPQSTPAAVATSVPSTPIVAAAQPTLDADDLGFDEPLEIASIPPQDLDLDPAFDPTFDAAQSGRANSQTASQPASQAARIAVTDLDEILAVPLEEDDAAFPLDRRADREPRAPEALTLAPEVGSADDLDFGFDVSEQATIAKVDLLEESFSSLLDVSDSQLLADPPSRPLPAAAPSAPSPTISASAPATPAGPPTPPTLKARGDVDDFLGADFDVSSGDLATTASRPVVSLDALPTAPATPAAPGASRASTPVTPFAPPPIPSPGDSGFALELDVVAHEPPLAPPPIPTGGARAAGSAPMISPLLEQHVQETLEKVAWEAFSDLSETIVKQVMERVERIAWEVIPQMAETLVREEIRKMKGEED